jgi:hypothetical protein
MAKKVTRATGGGASKSGRTSSKAKSSTGSRAVSRVSSSGNRGGRAGSDESFNAGDAFIKLLQSPLVADLLAVAATAALAALAEHGFSSRGGDDGAGNKRAGKAVKEAGKAAAAAIGRRLSNEIDEIREAAKASSKGGARA